MGQGTWGMGQGTWGKGQGAEPAAQKPWEDQASRTTAKAEPAAPKPWEDQASRTTAKAGQCVPMRSARTPMLSAYLWAQLYVRSAS
jgi:hypothetical protein